MKILHTSDIHLREYQDERWDALNELLRIGKQENIELFAISGDLFDKDVHGDELKPKLRPIFSNNGFKIFLIPGNHDKESFKSGVYFGEDIVLFNDLHTPYTHKDVNIWGFPFEYLEGGAIINKLHKIKEDLDENRINILLFHGELIDAFFSRNDMGEEGHKRYMPVKLSYFKDLNFDYILAGHIHSKFEVWQIGDGKYFIYPSSPISITSKEIGKRKVNLFEIGGPPKEYVLDTPHYEKIEIEFDPLRDEKPLEIIKARFENLHPNAKIILKLKGYLDSKKLGISETQFDSVVKEYASDKVVQIINEVQDISKIIEDDLFKKFTKKLKEKEFSVEEKKLMQEYTIKSMMGVR